jgi:hypothetical protein
MLNGDFLAGAAPGRDAPPEVPRRRSIGMQKPVCPFSVANFTNSPEKSAPIMPPMWYNGR